MDLPKVRPLEISQEISDNSISRSAPRLWILDEDFVIEVPGFSVGNYRQIRIPAEFIFDGASIPTPIWALVSPIWHAITPESWCADPRFWKSPICFLLRASVVHDYAYAHGGVWMVDAESGSSIKVEWSREYWDSVFYLIAKNNCKFPVIAKIAYLAVRLFGKSRWDAARKRS